MYPNPELNQILRCECSSNTSTANSDNRLPNNHAVVVSNFREPDRRLGRYSKYYYHHNVGPEVYSRKVFVGGLPGCVKESELYPDLDHYFKSTFQVISSISSLATVVCKSIGLRNILVVNQIPIHQFVAMRLLHSNRHLISQ